MRLLELVETQFLPEEDSESFYGEYVVDAANMTAFEAGLDKINKKAVSLGAPTMSIQSKVREVDNKGNVVYRIQVLGEPVRIKGWEFLATVEHGTGNSNVIRGVPGYDPTEVQDYLKAENTNCDFCNSRRDRLHTYIIKKTDGGLDGEFKQVGGQCLKKYMGDAAHKLVRYSFGLTEVIAKLNDKLSTTAGKSRVYGKDIITVLSVAAALIRTEGYKKVDAWDSTAGFVKAALYGWGFPGGPAEEASSRALVARIQEPTDADIATAHAAVEWFTNELSDGEKAMSSYLFSIKSIIEADFVSVKSVGLIVSLIPAYMRKAAAPQPRDDQPAAPESNYIGTPGQKLPPTKVTVVHTQEVNSQFGSSLLVKMVDEHNNNITWFDGKFSVEKGDQFTMTATVKKHEEFKGVKTTLVMRVKKV